MLTTLGMGALDLGARYHGNFEERLKSVLDEANGAEAAFVLFIAEPSVEQTISLLRGIEHKYEPYHCVRIDTSELTEKHAVVRLIGAPPVYGARPLKRAVQRYGRDLLANMILNG